MDPALFRIPFGRYLDMTLQDIADEPGGLLYLDELRCDRSSEEDPTSEFDSALIGFLEDEGIQERLENLSDETGSSTPRNHLEY